MEIVTVTIDSKWIKRINSPLFVIVQALSGISITFAPLFLYWSAEWGLKGPLKWSVIIICFVLIYFVPAFYMWIAGPIIRQIRGSAA